MRTLFVFLLLICLHAHGQDHTNKFRQLEKMRQTDSIKTLKAFGLKIDSVATFLHANAETMFPGQFAYTEISSRLKTYTVDTTNQIFPLFYGPISFPNRVTQSYIISPGEALVERYRDLTDSLYRGGFYAVYSYQPVLLSPGDSLYNICNALSNTGLYPADTSLEKMKFIRRLKYNTVGRYSFTDNFSDTAFKTFLKLPPELAHIPGIQELVVEGTVRTLKNKVPLDKPSESVVPICLKTSSGIYAFKKVIHISYEKESWDIVSQFERTYGETPFLRVDANREQTGRILKDMMVLLKNILASPPISAHIASDMGDQIICTRTRQKTDLLNGKYETSTYCFRVKANEFLTPTREIYQGIEFTIFLNVFAANHPDNPFEDVSPREMVKYDNAIKELRNFIMTELCRKYACSGNNPPVIR